MTIATRRSLIKIQNVRPRKYLDINIMFVVGLLQNTMSVRKHRTVNEYSTILNFTSDPSEMQQNTPHNYRFTGMRNTSLANHLSSLTTRHTLAVHGPVLMLLGMKLYDPRLVVRIWLDDKETERPLTALK